ncbi:Thioredoxin domain protein [Pirellula staleyi DSM 6068]|uniref:Thioredoxin domain protein n=1 Tax=Pirellula staleyi (strain ATCC 27377 / DSM 6068 / ICPB 4128) TaxID=530564 RepID=D2QY67_PIRSD|nr:tetratricopeptide repeat protein [Pirellula staleyi]ADB16281.1 Thioredoxin domain protein [Pirellula staleyi DSM 6068]
MSDEPKNENLLPMVSAEAAAENAAQEPVEKPWFIQETTAEFFERDVIEASHKHPVVVDFWATWCQPCRLLSPVLDKVVSEFDGQIVLVKADTDQVPRFAQAFRIDSIPAVFGLKRGKVVAQFKGLLPEERLREFFKSLLPTEAEEFLRKAQELEATDLAASEQAYREALMKSPNDLEALGSLARVLLAQNKLEDCKVLLAEAEKAGVVEGGLAKIAAQVRLASTAVPSDKLADLQSKLAADPKAHDIRLQWAEGLLAAGESRAALEAFLYVVENDRAKFRSQAREKMVDAFRVLGEENPLVAEFRRNLSLALY